MYLFVGERQSPLAAARGWRWEHGRVCAGTLRRALAAAGVPPDAYRIVNLWSAPGLGATDEPPDLAPVVAALDSGATIVALGRLVERHLTRAGVPHLFVVHPAARGKIRARDAYAAHVRRVLGP